MKLFNCQSLRQEHERDCGVHVFAKLAGVSTGELLRELPEAINGVTVNTWEEWLRRKGLRVARYQPNEEYSLPCGHLVERAPNYYHWLYRDEDGVQDPDPSFQFMPPNDPRMLNLACYAGLILTISVAR
jgi:hypothetical protein